MRRLTILELGRWGRVKDKTGDGSAFWCLEEAREEESSEVVRAVVGDNHPVRSRAYTEKVFEVVKSWLACRSKHVVTEKLLSDSRLGIMGMEREMQVASYFFVPRVRGKRSVFDAVQSGCEDRLQSCGAVTTVAEAKE
jgi:hypothetical protein